MSSVGAWHAVDVQQTVAVNFAHTLPTREAGPTWKSSPRTNPAPSPAQRPFLARELPPLEISSSTHRPL